MNKVKCVVNNRSYEFLLDTGATVSIVKRHVLKGYNVIEPLSQGMLITGISEQLLPVIGICDLLLYFQNNAFGHKFIVAENNLPLSVDGLIGIDFFKEMRCGTKFSPHESYAREV